MQTRKITGFALRLTFAHRIRAFYEASAKELGYELEDLADQPGEPLF